MHKFIDIFLRALVDTFFGLLAMIISAAVINFVILPILGFIHDNPEMVVSAAVAIGVLVAAAIIGHEISSLFRKH